ncbi:MAG: transporter [Rubripirellula sp.]|nr:transporter [Rubripirellula sp.]
MRKILSLMLLASLVCTYAEVHAQVCCDELNQCDAWQSCDARHGCDSCDGLFRLKFWDDLVGNHRGESRRDPYEERLETERHDFTQSTKTVGRGVVQLESGYSFFYKDHEEEIEQSHTFPETLLRIGLSDNIEFRLRYSYAWTFIDEAENQQGSQDLVWSFKLGMTEECGLRPESALELRFTAPTGGSDYSTRRVEHGLDYIYSWELAEKWELYGSTGYATGALGDFGFTPERPAEDWFVVFSQSVALGVEMTERTALYAEFFGLFSDELEDDFSAVVFNIGLDYYINDDFLLDIRVGKGLTPDSDDFFAGMGGGIRF